MPAPLHGYCGHVSRQNFVNDFARHIREAEVAPLKAGGQPGVVEAKAMQQCGVQLMDGIPGDVESVLIGCSVSDAGAKTSSRDPRAIRSAWLQIEAASRQIPVFIWLGQRPNLPPARKSSCFAPACFSWCLRCRCYLG